MPMEQVISIACSNCHPMPKKEHGFYFDHVPGPWNRYNVTTCLHNVDENEDGLDDILMCQDDKVGKVLVQHNNGTFTHGSMGWMEP